MDGATPIYPQGYPEISTGLRRNLHSVTPHIQSVTRRCSEPTSEVEHRASVGNEAVSVDRLRLCGEDRANNHDLDYRRNKSKTQRLCRHFTVDRFPK